MNSDKKKATINNTQFCTLLACMSWPTIIGYGSGIMARQAGRGMWFSGILALVTTGLYAVIYIYTGRKFPGRTVVQYSQQLLGTILGKVLGFGLFLYFLLTADQSVTIYIHHINDFLLPETPFLVLTVIHVIVVCYIVWHGPEVIARVSVIGFFAAVLFSFLVFLATLQEIDLHRILPVFDYGIPAVGAATLTANAFVGQSILVTAMVLPLVKDQKKATRSVIAGLTGGGVMVVFFFIAELMVMGPHVTAQMRVACMDLVRSVQITQYLHRFESFMVALWYWSMLVQAGILAWCATLAFRQVVGIKGRNKWVVMALGAILISITYFTSFNRVIFLNFLEYKWPYLSLPVQFGLPLFLLLISFFRKKPAVAGE